MTDDELKKTLELKKAALEAAYKALDFLDDKFDPEGGLQVEDQGYIMQVISAFFLRNCIKIIREGAINDSYIEIIKSSTWEMANEMYQMNSSENTSEEAGTIQ